jgi:hypothetical protein
MSAPSSTGFQAPRFVPSPEGCSFYHSIEPPGFGLQVGHWDLRAAVDDYLGHQYWKDRRMVDVGVASGFISLELERRGADVISFDRSLDDRSDETGILSFTDFQAQFGRTLEAAIERRLANQRRLQDSYWLAQRLFQSKNRLYCGNVSDGMPGVDEADVSFFGCILLHLRDPLLALTRFARLTREALIVTDGEQRG